MKLSIPVIIILVRNGVKINTGKFYNFRHIDANTYFAFKKIGGKIHSPVNKLPIISYYYLPEFC